ncbi:capsular biosynthesis protein CpsH [Pedobacter sp. HMWF019]|uniref:capsular biosynthesis protein CpsH n=1 Tax=Pedobacter sp. HMWF019 TaxID=2056856 RepID=UPI000D36B1CF|nr:capsular biosynthesis protein CpsH [Pedobacter sp. HMWF019]PTS95970.1 capsular biosynthesis protein CpsH [Pedobacter sp. HMWF019]
MTLDLAGKNILLISPRYFNYEQEIQIELERRGAFVYYIDDRIKNSTINKAFFRLKLAESLGKKKVFNYFSDHLKKMGDRKFDYLLAIIPEGFSKEIIEFYRSQFKDTTFILYMWDSIDNRPYIIETLGLYDRTLTFDKSNSEKYGLKFRPLFFTNHYERIGKEGVKSKYKFDLSFVGTAHSDRYSVIKRFVSTSKSPLNNFFFFFLQHPVLIAYYWMVDPNFRNVNVKDISFKGMSKEDVLDVISNSTAIIDINHPNQTGLTIRTLEVLGAKRKLITTNKDILNYDFYNTKNISLIDRENPVIDNEFLSSGYDEVEESVYNKYSLSSWVDDVFSNLK